MKVIFVKDQLPTAIAGDVLDVRDGFARNYLLPRQIAILATTGNLLSAKKLQQQAVKRRELMKQDWQSKVEGVSEQEIKLTALCSPTGRLYGSVTSGQIADKLSEITGAEVTRRQILLEQPIKMTGKHPFTWMAHKGVTAKLRVTVEGDKSEAIEPIESPTESGSEEVPAEGGSEGTSEDSSGAEATSETAVAE